MSGPWFLRAGHLFLIPGDSPMGYRLPLDSLPWVDAGRRARRSTSADPFAAAPPLPPRQLARSARSGRRTAPSGSGRRHGAADRPRGTRPRPDVDPHRALRRAARRPAPRLHAAGRGRRRTTSTWSPPSKRTAAALSDAGDHRRARRRIDPRLNHFKVTPDPGVIEVNIHPAHSWHELVEQTTTLYEEARQSRLGTEKFMLDGRHTGTGGGNHIVLGGPTPADSPLLRRPDLLRSLLGYWHNHPSLSYLFSGLFVGPTSQHPRVDEARNDSLYELEIAFAQIAGRDGDAPPWLVDRVFRNLLIDVTGNTHRAEFCIDKLYSPDDQQRPARAGRAAGVRDAAARAHEPGAAAAAARAGRPVLEDAVRRSRSSRWGTELHDRFMLPHFVAQDFRRRARRPAAPRLRASAGVVRAALSSAFPLYGAIAPRGVHLELRQALEPWHVLGEEAGRRRHRALRRFVGRAAAGQGDAA